VLNENAVIDENRRNKQKGHTPKNVTYKNKATGELSIKQPVWFH